MHATSAAHDSPNIMNLASYSPAFRRRCLVACLLVSHGAWSVVGKSAAQTPEEHASHHPGAAGAPAAETMPATIGGPSSGGMGKPTGAGGMVGGGMGEMMDGMMKKMGVPPPKDLYPTLMAVPELTPEKRQEVERQASQRMHSGTVLMGQALDALNLGNQSGNYPAMHEATTQLREGIAQLESGIAARRALSEGRPPRDVALAWFKQEMNLTPGGISSSQESSGITPFHLFSMVLLVVFAVAMLVLYFFKMRRAAELFGRIEASKGPPPPGAAPELAGGKPPPKDSPPTGPRPGDEPPSGGGKQPPNAPPDNTVSPTAEPASIPPMESTSPARTRDAVKLAARAHELWEARGRPIGSPDTDWQHARAELEEEGGRIAIGAAASLVPASVDPVPDSPPPLTENWRGQLRVGSIIEETPNVKTFRLLPNVNGHLPFTFGPGQFLNLAFWIGGARMNRSYSISSSPNQRGYLDLTVRREPRGAVSRHIVDLLKVGDQIEAGGPVGNFTFTGKEADSIVLISGGVGITPMVSISRYLTEKSWPGDIFFIYVCRTPADYILADDIAVLEKNNSKFHVVVTMTRPEGTAWKGPRGHLTAELLAQSVPSLTSRRIHLCGPIPMMDATKALLIGMGVPPDQLKTESFGTTKPTPPPAGTTAKRSAAPGGPLVTFSKTHKSAKARIDLQTGDSPPQQTILELSEELGIGIQFSCRVGTCGVCKVKMTTGEVDQEIDAALNDDDKAHGIILACQAKPKNAVTVEA